MAYNSCKSSDFWSPSIDDDDAKKHSSSEPLFVSSGVDNAINESGGIVPDSGFQDCPPNRGRDTGADKYIIIGLLCIILATVGIAVGRIAYDLKTMNMSLTSFGRNS